MPITVSNSASNLKKDLQARKEKILQDIKYYEKRIQDFHASASTSSNTYFDNSLDSDDDLPVPIDNGPSISQLKTTESHLRICLQATNELTSLQILQSHVTVLVEDPVIHGDSPVKEPGSWRQVTADCKIDMVPFCIHFNVHQANRTFAPKLYRNLKVMVSKASHEAELSKSILPSIKQPSEAMEVLRSYAAAYRSRRATLFKLAEEYGHHLLMEPAADGGYVLKCANVLEISWCLENKRSPLTAFHHTLKFDLEYMDESYIRIISQAHKQLSNPSIETDERTLLLATIINACLDAKGLNNDVNTSMESEKSTPEKRISNGSDATEPLSKKKRDKPTYFDKNERDGRQDEEIMAPPKSLPKKIKPKGKENADQNRKSLKRASKDDTAGSNKKIKTDMGIREIVDELDKARKEDNFAKNKDNLAGEDNVKAITKTDLKQKNSNKEQVKNDKTKELKNAKNGNSKDKNAGQKTVKNQVTEKNSNIQENAKNSKEIQEKSNKTDSQKASKEQKVDKNIVSAKNDPKSKEAPQKVISTDKVIASSKTDPKTKNIKTAKETNSANNVASSKNDSKTNEDNVENHNKASSKNGPKTTDSNTKKSIVKSKNVAKNTPGNTNQAETSKTKDKISTKNDKTDDKNVGTKDIVLKKGVVNSKNIKQNLMNAKLADPIKKSTNTNDKVNIISDVLVASSKTNNLPKATKPEVANAKNSKENEKSTNENKSKENNTQKPQSNTNKLPNVAINEPKIIQKNTNANVKTVESNTKRKDVTEKLHKMKNIGISTKEHIADRTNSNNVAIKKKSDTKTAAGNTNNKISIKNLSHKNPTAQMKLRKSSSNINVKTSNTANLITSNTKQNGVAAKTSKIPQKRLTPISERSSKRNPLRISPRKIALSFKCASDSNLKQKIQLKHGTNIPKLTKKPELKSK